jgi:hypothetical protein
MFVFQDAFEAITKMTTLTMAAKWELSSLDRGPVRDLSRWICIQNTSNGGTREKPSRSALFSMSNRRSTKRIGFSACHRPPSLHPGAPNAAFSASLDRTKHSPDSVWNVDQECELYSPDRR